MRGGRGDIEEGDGNRQGTMPVWSKIKRKKQRKIEWTELNQDCSHLSNDCYAISPIMGVRAGGSAKKTGSRVEGNLVYLHRK